MIRMHLKSLEKQADLIEELRDMTKSEGGRLTHFGREFIRIARQNELQQSFVAKLLDITPGAVSQNYNKL
jgi:Mn-dependent DtxR family transcriptional regulator